MADMEHPSFLVDSIYEAAVLPSLWPGVIEKVAAATGSFGGSLFTVGPNHSAVAASENCVEHLDALLKGHWSAINIRAQRVVAMAEMGFVSDEDFASPQEIAHHPIYTEFLRPRGLGWTAATHIMGVDEDIAIFSIDRRHAQGAFDRDAIAFLDTLRPHISRAVLLSSKFQAQAVNGSLQGLQTVGIPAAALDARGRVRLMNAPFSRLQSQICAGALDQIRVADEAANRLLRQALAEADRHDGAPMSIGVRGTAEEPPFVLHLTPLRGQGRDVFSGIAFIVAIVPLTQPGLPFRMLVQRLYDFTPAEARVAENLVAGRSAAQIASLYRISQETVRTQTKSILAKTGISRQAEFVARFSSFRTVAGE